MQSESTSHQPQEALSNTEVVFSASQLQLLKDQKLWNDLKDKAVRLTIANEQKNMASIVKLLELLDIVIEVGLKAFTEQQIAFFIDDVLFTVLKNLLEHRQYQQEQSFQSAEQIVLKTLEIIAGSIDSDYPKLSEILSLIFNCSRQFYSNAIVLKQPNNNYVPTIGPAGTEIVQDEKILLWQESLKVGDIIDQVKVDSSSIWSRARIHSISDAFLRIVFIDDATKIITTSKIRKNALASIAPFGTRSKDFEWRSALKIGDQIDASDNMDVYHRSTVIGEEYRISPITKEQERLLVIGFRTYTNGFDPNKLEDQEFEGLDSSYDVTINPHSPRIFKLNKLSRKVYPPANLQGKSHYPDDPNDYLYEEDNKTERIFAIFRAHTNKNANFVRYINYFGKIGGFDRILNRLQKSNQEAGYCPVEIIANFMETIGNLSIYLYIEFSKQYVPLLWKAVQSSLMQPSEQYLRTYEKERLENIINSLEQILPLAYSSGEKITLTEELSLTLSLKCYQSDVLKQRIAGLKLICQIIRYVLLQNHKSDDNIEMRPKQFALWMKKHQILENIYIQQIHSELINRSSELLKFAIDQNLLTEQLVQDIFQAIDRQDEMTKQGFLKLIGEVASWFKPNQVSAIMRNIKKTELKELSVQHIDVIYELVRFKKYYPQILVSNSDDPPITTQNQNNVNGQDNTQQTSVVVAPTEDPQQVNPNTIDALWYIYDLVTNTSFISFSIELKQKIIDHFCHLISLEDGLTQRKAFLHRSIQDMRKNLSVSQLLQIIKQIIETYPSQQPLILPLSQSKVNQQPNSVQESNNEQEVNQNPSQNESEVTQPHPPAPIIPTIETKAIAAHSLVSEQKLVEVVLQNIHVIKQQFKKKLDSQIQQSDKNSLLALFREQVAERIDFIKYVNSILTEKIITTDFLEQVWKDIVEEPLDINERDIVFKWLRELAIQKDASDVVCEVENFLKRQLLKNNEFIEHLSFDGFLCYKEMFLSLNIQKKHLQSITMNMTSAQNKRYNYNQFGAVTSISGGFDSTNKDNNQNTDKNNSNNSTGEFKYFVIIRPQDLHGMDLLWEIVYKNKVEKVVQSCQQFLVNLHLHLESSTTKEIQYQIRLDLIMNLIGRIRQIDHKKESIQIKRLLDILTSLLNESEKKGIGHLTSLIGLVKGELQNLTITNEMSLSYVQDGLKKQDIKIESNKTIIDLKILIASKFGCSWDQVKITRSNLFKQLQDSDNSRTIGEIRFKPGENLIIEKRITSPIPEANLLNPDESIAEKPKKIFTDWFYRFAQPAVKLMDAKGVADFIHSCTGDICTPTDSRVTTTLALWDSNKDGLMTLSDFLNFYQNASKEKKIVVWKNLHSHGFRNDLKHLSEIGEDVQDLDILPRKIIMDNAEFYELMYDLLDVQELSESVMNLLNRLPASPHLVRKILNLEGVKNTVNADWSSIFDMQNTFKLLQTLTLIEYFMEDDDERQGETEEKNNDKEASQNAGGDTSAITDAQQQQFQSSNETSQTKNENSQQQSSEVPSTLQKQKAESNALLRAMYSENSTIDPKRWREEFISCGGFDQLFKVFTLFSKDPYTKLPVNTKNILSFILRIMKNYLTAVFTTKVEHLFKINSYTVQIKYSLDVINENLRKAESGEKTSSTETNGSQASHAAATGNQENQQTTQSAKESDELAAELASGLASSTPYSNVTPLHPDYLKGDNSAQQKKNYSFWGNRTIVKEPQEFLQLVEKMRGKLGDMILATLDIGSMLQKMLEIAVSVVSIDGELESEDRGIVDFCCVIILDILLFDPSQRNRLLEESELCELFDKLALKGLFHVNLNTRRVFSHFLYLISRYDKSKTSAHLLDLLMKNLPSSKDLSKSDCNQYYDILCKIIEESKSIINIKIDFATLMQETIENIMNHISKEARYNGKNDKMLIGFLNLCEKILKIEPTLSNCHLEEFAKYLFNVCLFCKDPEQMLEDSLDYQDIQSSGIYEFNPPFYVKCKSSESRQAAYKILINILKSNKSIFSDIIAEGINVLIDTLRTPISWNYRPSNEQKCFYNYLGIKNLSQICYMNSMLQQFYMTKTFRYGILAADDQKEAELVEYRGQFYDDNLLHQIQKMFSYLDLSDRQDYNPTGFCFSFKDYMGQPTNVGVQQDAQEFLNMIFDKLESELRNTPFKYLLQSVFGGKTCSQMICSACGNIKSKHEMFYTQQLRVEGCKKLSESFLKMIEGETISDFKCDACEKRCDQSRRVFFSQLPNVLIIQLQRIVFDLDTFVNKKINSRLEFPHILDLTEFTSDHIDKIAQEQKEAAAQSADQDNQTQSTNEQPQQEQNNASVQNVNLNEYRLKGITVHQGTAELGHYYSYINYKDDKWLEFNDSHIRDFNPQNIESECFGGSSSSASENSWEKGENSKNAYILVYERISKTPLRMVTTTEEQQKQIEDNLQIEIKKESPAVPKEEEEKDEERISEIDFFSIKQRIPKKLFLDTWLDNHNFMLEKHVYSQEFFTFLSDLLMLVELPEDYKPQQTTNSFIYPKHLEISAQQQTLYENVLQMCGKLFFNIFYKASDFEILKELGKQINQLIDLVPHLAYKFAEQFIFDKFKQIENVLTVCSEPVVRTAFINVILHTINTMINYYSINFTLNESELNNIPEDQLSEKDSCERDIMDYLDKKLNIMGNEVAKNWLRMQQYLEFWRGFAHGGDAQVDWCFRHEMIARLIDFFLGAASPLTCFTQKRYEIGNRFVSTPFGPLIQCVSYLISRVRLVGLQNPHQFSQNDSSILDSQEFYVRAMQENYDCPSICYIGQLMSYKNKVFSESFGKLILRGIFKSNSDHINQYLEIMQAFLMIQDEYSHLRIEWILGYGTLKINSTDGYETRPFVDEATVFYDTKLRQENLQSVLQILYNYRKMWESLCLHILKKVLLLCKNDSRILNYIMRVPAPSHCCAHYLSWVRLHLESMLPQEESQQNSIKYPSVGNNSNPKEELAKQTMVLYEEIETIINSYAQNELNQNNTSTSKRLESLWPTYIIGKTIEQQETMSTVLAEDSEENTLTLREIEYTTMYTNSQPTGATNTVFPEAVVSGNMLMLSAIDLPKSNLQDYFLIASYADNIKEQNNDTNDNQNNSASKIPRAPILKGLQKESPTINLTSNYLGKNNLRQTQDKTNPDCSSSNNNGMKKVEEESSEQYSPALSPIKPNQLLKRNSSVDEDQNQFTPEKAITEETHNFNQDNNEQHANENNAADTSINSSKAQAGEEDFDAQENNIPQDGEYTDWQRSSDEFKAQVGQQLEHNPTILHSANDEEQQKNEAESIQQQDVQQLDIVCQKTVVQLQSHSGPVVRRYIIDNNSRENSAKVAVSFIMNNSDSDVEQGEGKENNANQLNEKYSSTVYNQHMPIEIFLEIEPFTSVTIFSTRKVNPEKPWTQYQVISNCQFNLKPGQEQNEPDAVLSSQALGEAEPETNTESYHDDAISDVIGPQLPGFGHASNAGTNDQQKECPVCTLIQPGYNVCCEVCETPFS